MELIITTPTTGLRRRPARLKPFHTGHRETTRHCVVFVESLERHRADAAGNHAVTETSTAAISLERTLAAASNRWTDNATTKRCATRT